MKTFALFSMSDDRPLLLLVVLIGLAMILAAGEAGASEGPDGAPPDILCQVDPASLDFGEAVIGDTLTLPFMIYNLGDTVMTGYVDVESSEFQVVAGRGLYDLTPGESLFVLVAFIPTMTGYQEAGVETGTYCPVVPCYGYGSPPCSLALTCPDDVFLLCGEPTDPDRTGYPLVSATCPPLDTVFIDSVVGGECPYPEMIYRAWRVTDASGNSLSCVQTITMFDSLPPVFDPPLPPDLNVECAEEVPPRARLTASDDCGGQVEVSFTEAVQPGSCEDDFTLFRTWTAEDGCGRTAIHRQTIRVRDYTPPVFDLACPEDIEVECQSEVPPPATMTATDNCDPDVDVTYTEDLEPGGCTNRYNLYRNWTATDRCGNMVSCSQQIRVDDRTAPVFDQPCPPDLVLDCHETVPDAPVITASDNCDESVHVSYTQDFSEGDCFSEFSLHRTWIAADICGNVSECSQVITVIDTIPPEITMCPNDTTVDCISRVPNPDGNLVTAVDNCGDPTVAFLSDVSDHNECPETITRTYRVTDLCGNHKDCSQRIEVYDLFPPTILCESDMTVPENTPWQFDEPTALDNCDPDPAIHVLWDEVNPGPGPGDTTYTRCWEARDLCGNADSCCQNVTVTGTGCALDIDCPPDAVLSCSDPSGPEHTGYPDVSGTCPPIDLEHQDQISAGPCRFDYTITRTWTATDSEGNAASCVQMITFRDQSRPVLICAPQDTVSCGTVISFEDPVASDNCSAPGDISTEVISSTSVRLPRSPYIVHTRCWQALDECGNRSLPCCQSILEGPCPDDPFELDVVDDVDPCVDPGVDVRYIITYHNPNWLDVTDVVLIDQMPAEVDFIAASDNGLYDPIEHTVTWMFEVVDGDMTGDVTLDVTVAPGTTPGTTIVNSASISGSSVFTTHAAEQTPVCTESEDCIDVSLPPETMAGPGETVRIAVTTEDLTGWGVMAFDMEVCWCDIPSGLLTLVGCSPGDVMTGSHWSGPICNPCSTNCVSIAASGAQPLEGEGELLYLEFHVSSNAKPCMCCSLEVDGTVYDPENPLEICWSGGKFCVEWCDVSGCVKYWRCCEDACGDTIWPYGLEGARVHLSDCHGPVATAFTGEEGCYEFTCLDPLVDCGYCVDVGLCPIPDCINAFDAALVLQHIVCLDDLDDCQFESEGLVVLPQVEAADVSCQGGITSYDASLILQYAVGLIPLFPCPDSWVWFAQPAGCGYACPVTVDYVGVLKGDVDGCYDCGGGILFDEGDPVLVDLGPPSDLGDRYEVAVVVEGAYDIFSCDMTLTFDASDLYVIDMVPAGLAEGSMSAYHDAAGVLDFAMASASSYGGDGPIALITMGKMHAEAGISSLTLTDVTFNNGYPPAQIGNSAGIPDEAGVSTALGPAVPNPFSGGTTIGFQLAEAAEVTLEIYNVEGQLVRCLVNEVRPSGKHLAVWDGLDAEGVTVSRGVYFCCMESGGFKATSKMVLVR